MAYWTYQVNPRNFKMEEMLRDFRDHGERENVIAFQPRDREKKISTGDLVFLCETAAKRNPGVLGKARVTGPPTKDVEGPEWQQKFWVGKESDLKDLPRVPMKIEKVFNSRIPRSELRENPCFSGHPFAKGYRGTMREMTEIQASELDHLADR